jgi:hypothetical protein
VVENKIKLQFTGGYHLHFDQISRILQYSLEQNNRERIPRQEILEALGMTERQFENLSSMSVGLGIIKPRIFILTSLGKIIAQKDVFFDNVDTLWIMHYIVSSEPKWVVWNRVVTQIFSGNTTINIKIAIPYYSDLSVKFLEKSMKTKLPKEIASVLNAYGEQRFKRLHILEKISSGEYVRFEVVQIKPLPFLYCLLHFRDEYFSVSTGVLIKDIMRMENSPGKVLCLQKYKIDELLNKLHDMELIRIEIFGDLDQIRFAEGLTKNSVLQKIYGNEE